jgi:transcriptional regulator with XRE-family HTH domain
MNRVIYEEIAERVPCSADMRFWSCDDFIKYFCPEISPREIDAIIDKMCEKVGDLPLVHCKMAILADGRLGWSKGSAFREEHLLDVLSLLPGRKARRVFMEALTSTEPEVRLGNFVEIQRPYWEAEGRQYQKRRESLGLKVQHLADAIGVSPSVIRNFENGNPVSRARFVRHACSLALENIELRRCLTEDRIKRLRERGKLLQLFIPDAASRRSLEAAIEQKDDDHRGIGRVITEYRRRHSMSQRA